MQGKTALITGASLGLGLEMARLCAADGGRVILVARNRSKLEELSASLGVEARVIAADLTRPGAGAQVVEEVGDWPVDVLINNAGFGLFGHFVENDMQQQLDMIQLNVTVLTELCHRFAPGMVSRRWGRIMNVASTAAFQPGPLMAVYYATKAYVLHFSEALANELRGTGVTVTAFCPGPTRTGFQSAAKLEQSRMMKVFSRMPGAEAVARSGYHAMKKGRVIHIPGFMNWLMAQGVRLAPRSVLTASVRQLQERTH